MDLANLSDVELTQHYLKTVSGTPSRRALKKLEAEAHRRGPERMATARRVLGDAREAARQASACTVCGTCEPVAAYGGWCCAQVLQ